MNHPLRLLAMMMVGLYITATGTSQAPQPARPGCTLDFQDHYRCKRDAFQQRLAASKTVRIDTDRLDLFAHTRTQQLVKSLGKTPVGPEQQPDLVFDLSPIDRTGRVDLSPAAVPLATLTVYDTSMGAGARSRIWVETIDGDADKPWPGIVADLLRKFQADALSH